MDGMSVARSSQIQFDSFGCKANLNSVFHSVVSNIAAMFVRLISHQPASTFLSEQTSHQQSASSTFLSEQISTSHQPPAKRTARHQTANETHLSNALFLFYIFLIFNMPFNPCMIFGQISK
jgi:hypothetical protein